MNADSVERVLMATNAAFEMIGAGQLILSRLLELQKRREAENRDITPEDVAAMMDAGDIEAKLQRARIAEALAKQRS